MNPFYVRSSKRAPQLPLLIALLSIAIFTSTRVGLVLLSGKDLVPLALWPSVFGKGLWLDLAVVAWLPRRIRTS